MSRKPIHQRMKKPRFLRGLRPIAVNCNRFKWAVRDFNNPGKPSDFVTISEALQMRCTFDHVEAFPEIAELLSVFGQLSEREQQRCRRRVRQLVMESRELSDR